MSSAGPTPGVNSLNGSTAIEQPARRFSTAVVGTGAALLVVFLVSHWSTLSRMAQRWEQEPQYSHGFLVPVFALVVLWSRREMLKRIQWRPAWHGLPVLLLGVSFRLFAIQLDMESFDALGMLLSIFGTVLLVGG